MLTTYTGLVATSYNGWPASSSASAIGINTRWEPIRGHRFPGGIKGGDVEVVFTYLVRQLDARVEPIEEYRDGDEWGWYYKYSANSPHLLSCHSSGTAIDYNATQHPNGRRGTWSSRQIAEIRKIQYELGGVIRWLYDSSGTPDEMHFEIRGSVSAVRAVANRIRQSGGNPPPTPTPAPQEMFTVGQYEEIIRKIDNLGNAMLIDIAEGREEGDDVPANGPAILKELRVNQRAALTELNRLREKEGLEPLKIVIGYQADGRTPIYANE